MASPSAAPELAMPTALAALWRGNQLLTFLEAHHVDSGEPGFVGDFGAGQTLTEVYRDALGRVSVAGSPARREPWRAPAVEDGIEARDRALPLAGSTDVHHDRRPRPPHPDPARPPPRPGPAAARPPPPHPAAAPRRRPPPP